MASIVAENELFFTMAEPKMKNRYKVYLDGMPSFMIRGFSRPQIEQNQKTIAHINTEYYVKGKSRWSPVSMTIYDFIMPSSTQAVMEWIRLGHESVTGRDGYMDFYKKDIILNALGPVGDKVEEWTLKGAWVTRAQFGDMSFTEDDPMEITIELSIDYAVLGF